MIWIIISIKTERINSNDAWWVSNNFILPKYIDQHWLHTAKQIHDLCMKTRVCCFADNHCCSTWMQIADFMFQKNNGWTAKKFCRNSGLSICLPNQEHSVWCINQIIITDILFVSWAGTKSSPYSNNRCVCLFQDQICESADILMEKAVHRVATTVAALVAIATHSKHPAPSNVW